MCIKEKVFIDIFNRRDYNKNMLKEKIKVKEHGQIFTPAYIVTLMLDFAGYNGRDILQKTVMENSCGNGAFLIEIVNRYCRAFLCQSDDKAELKRHLETYIYGIEKDALVYAECIDRLNHFMEENFGIKDVVWQIENNDALMIYNHYHEKMDFIIGNPPYVRIHNFLSTQRQIKSFSFTDEGMSDIYLAFFEIGFSMLSKQGKMCLITPCSCLKSKAGRRFRDYLRQNRILDKIIDLRHFQPFNAITYTIITVFDNKRENTENFDYYVYDADSGKEKYVDTLNFQSTWIDGKIFLDSRQNLNEIKRIDFFWKNRSERSVSVKNGFATLADSVFIGDFEFESEHIIKVLKASTGEWKKCIFPYRKDGTPLKYEELLNDKNLMNYLESHRKDLEKRSFDSKGQWYLFGRTQALRDVNKNRIAVNQLIKTRDSLKIHKLRPNEGVYSGLYILASECELDKIEFYLRQDEFISYVKSLQNYKSGGYYTFSSIDLEKYLVYKINQLKEVPFEYFKSC